MPVMKPLHSKSKVSELTKLFVLPDTKLLDAVKKLDKNNEKILMVVDNSLRLLGTITDGDIRRSMLRNAALDCPVREVMHKKPSTLKPGYSVEEANSLIEKLKISYIPVLDEGKVVDLVVCGKILRPAKYSNPVVIMAGGRGKRLRPITENIPKPMVCVGGRPILETIVQRLEEQGFSKLYLCVNYKSEMIKDHFGDGSKFGVQIKYTEEDKELGTGGALGLIKDKFTEPFLVMNSDLLTKVDFGQMLNFHAEHNSAATMGVRKYSYDVPFGVVNIDDDKIVGIVEKPTQNFFVNAGIYILSPEVKSYIVQNEHLDMPSLFSKLLENNKHTAAYHLREYWLDIGRLDELQKAEREFSEHFS